MNEAQEIKRLCLKLAVEELELLLKIIGDLGYPTYMVARFRLGGATYGQCANKFGISKSSAQWYWNKCREKGYHHDLLRIFKIPDLPSDSGKSLIKERV